MTTTAKKILVSVSAAILLGVYIIYQQSFGSSASSGGSSSDTAAASPTPSAQTVTQDASTSSAGSASAAAQSSGRYRDGVYTGEAVSALYGTVQVRVTVKSGAITDVAAIQAPGDRARTKAITQAALPVLRREVIQAQSATIDAVSGATDLSNAYKQSLASALAQA